MPRELRDFLNLHAGETAWLFGKGPSLDRFDMALAGPLRVAINDVVRYVPGCRYGFANDSVERWAEFYQPGQVLFQPLRVLHDIHAGKPPLACERVWFADDWDDDRLVWPIERVAEHGLTVRRGTLGSAGQLLRLMGVAKVVCVGIDGGGQHAARSWRTELRTDHAPEYSSIRAHFIHACRLSGLPVEFHGADLSQQLPDGMKTIKVIENILVGGIHCCSGAIIEQPPHIADQLVADGLAVHWRAPVSTSAAEVATAAPAQEQAVVSAPSSPRRRKAAPAA